MAGSGRTLLQALDYWAAAQPDKVLHTFLDDRGNPVNALTYSGLLAQSRAVAATLLSSSSSSSSGRKKGCGLRRGDRALLVFPPCLDFIVTFYACLRAGIVAVPVFPPGTLPEYLDDVLFFGSSSSSSSGADLFSVLADFRYSPVHHHRRNSFEIATLLRLSTPRLLSSHPI